MDTPDDAKRVPLSCPRCKEPAPLYLRLPNGAGVVVHLYRCIRCRELIWDD
ncbi:hypothetical protein ACVIW0_004406 [Bradyrhizobium sp. USDA 4454]